MAVALVVVAFEAQQRHDAFVQEFGDMAKGRLARRRLQHLLVEAQRLPIARSVTVAVVLRVAEITMMHVLNARGAECPGKRRLRESGFARDRSQSDVNQDGDALGLKNLDQLGDAATFVSNADDLWGSDNRHGPSIPQSQLAFRPLHPHVGVRSLVA